MFDGVRRASFYRATLASWIGTALSRGAENALGWLVVVAVVVTSGLAIVGENRLADPNAARRGP